MATSIVKWQLEKRIIFTSLEGEQDKDDFLSMNDAMFSLLDAGQSPVHVILDVSKLTKPYVDISLVSKKTIANDKRIGHLAIIGAKGMVQFLINVIGNLTQANVHLVNSLAEAEVLLREKDSTIPTL